MLAAAVALSACSNSVYKSHTARVARIPAAMESMVNVSDLEVSETKVTGIRTAEHSKVINALVNAAKNGKQVSVLVELKARFDEEQNIEYTDLLQREGVKVIYAIEDLKVHSKIVLVERRESSGVRGYAYIGTGNFRFIRHFA